MVQLDLIAALLLLVQMVALILLDLWVALVQLDLLATSPLCD